jgi:hypothetical protein
MTISYGPRDAVSVLMANGHKVARRWRGQSGDYSWYWLLDRKRVTLAELEDQAEVYERIRYRHTPRSATGPGGRLRSVSVVTDLHR